MRNTLFGNLKAARNNVRFMQYLREQAEGNAAIAQTQLRAKTAVAQTCNTKPALRVVRYPQES